MLKRMLKSIIAARQAKADREIAQLLQKIEYKREDVAYIEYKVNIRQIP
jgi:hypothetical protein